jgi:hypothetical protein
MLKLLFLIEENERVGSELNSLWWWEMMALAYDFIEVSFGFSSVDPFGSTVK